VAKLKDVAPGTATKVETGNEAVALVNVNGTFCAVQGQCPHAGGPLSEGKLDGWSLECPMHGAAFDVRTGDVLGGPADQPLRTYPVKVEDGAVRVAVPGHALAALHT
jgi:3-phenylpropionate/trans-cinnamate dioxygenase ferredoxin subunit